MTHTHALQALQQYFGYEAFRPMQAEIIQHVYEGKDSLVLMPTGGGKSICFQIPAITLEGTCVVISPLISLMKDQVEGLKANGVSAAFLNSTLSSAETRGIEEDLLNGRLDLLYVSPERICSNEIHRLLSLTKINLFAIDEAHCVSNWGHDFRPEYTQLSFLKRQFSGVPVIALTATADKLTRKDIIQQLNLEAPEVFIASFDRPNIELEVKPGFKRMEQILDFLRQRPNEPGILYTLSRKSTEKLAAKLKAAGHKAAAYHAGLDGRLRAQVQEDFINDRIKIVCATIAFGMGIDKSNVRWVIHYSLPKNMEGYYQEIGRSGRDGAKAHALLFFSFGDVMVLRDIIHKSSDPSMVEVREAKLERMLQYAEAAQCRRRILLGYFGEELGADCGNCDVCKNPPTYFNGTTLAQKALSAVARTRERIGINMLVDVLRGSKRKEILQKGYDQIKTYGVGGDISTFDWQQLIAQMINLGLLEVAYDEHHVLKLTDMARAVLFDGKEVQLVRITDIQARKQEAKAKAAKPQSQRQRLRDALFERLRAVRRSLAQQQGIPPYLIFTDATLEEMSAMRPTTLHKMLEVSGVGEAKLKRFAKPFILEIQQVVREEMNAQAKAGDPSTHQRTFLLYKRGFNPEQIAMERNLARTTVESHLAKLYLDGFDIDIKRFVSKQEIERILKAKGSLTQDFKMKDLYVHMNEEVSYFKIKMALAFKERKMIEA